MMPKNQDVWKAFDTVIIQVATSASTVQGVAKEVVNEGKVMKPVDKFVAVKIVK